MADCRRVLIPTGGRFRNRRFYESECRLAEKTESLMAKIVRRLTLQVAECNADGQLNSIFRLANGNGEPKDYVSGIQFPCKT